MVFVTEIAQLGYVFIALAAFHPILRRQVSLWSKTSSLCSFDIVSSQSSCRGGHEDLEFTWEEHANIELVEWCDQVMDQVPLCYNYKKRFFAKKCTCPKKEFVTASIAPVKLEKGLHQTYFKQFLSASPNNGNAIISLPWLDDKTHVLCILSFRNIFIIRDEHYAQLQKQMKSGNLGPNATGLK